MCKLICFSSSANQDAIWLTTLLCSAYDPPATIHPEDDIDPDYGIPLAMGDLMIAGLHGYTLSVVLHTFAEEVFAQQFTHCRTHKDATVEINGETCALLPMIYHSTYPRCLLVAPILKPPFPGHSPDYLSGTLWYRFSVLKHGEHSGWPGPLPALACTGGGMTATLPVCLAVTLCILT